MLTLLATLVAVFKGLNIATRVYILVPVVAFLVQAVIALIYRARQRSKINIEVTTDDGFSQEQYFTVTNHGEDRLFTAECQIEGSNRPESYPKGAFRLGWGDGTRANTEITQHTSARALLASIQDVIPHDLLEMKVWKVVEGRSLIQWRARWNAEGNEALPYLNVRLTVVAGGTKKPWVKCFVLMPMTPLGPLSLKSIEVST